MGEMNEMGPKRAPGSLQKRKGHHRSLRRTGSRKKRMSPGDLDSHRGLQERHPKTELQKIPLHGGSSGRDPSRARQSPARMLLHHVHLWLHRRQSPSSKTLLTLMPPGQDSSRWFLQDVLFGMQI